MASGLPWGLALSSGVNTYLPLFLLALFARFSNLVHVSPRFQWLISDQALIVLGILATCEILAQKFPVVDNGWDFVHTLFRPVAGALAAGATLTTDNLFETALGMVVGATLATAAHSTKTSVRLASTTKSFGTANFVISFLEDLGVIAGTLIAVYAPWVMLGLVLVFAVFFALIGPRIIRTLAFDLGILVGGFTFLVKQAFGARHPADLKESLLEMTPEHLRDLGASLEPGEELLGALRGWKRARGGPRSTWLLVTSRRLVWLQPRFLRAPKVETVVYEAVSMARFRSLILFAKLEVLSRRNETFTLGVSRHYAAYAEMAARRIQDSTKQAAESRPASLPASPHPVSLLR